MLTLTHRLHAIVAAILASNRGNESLNANPLQEPDSSEQSRIRLSVFHGSPQSPSPCWTLFGHLPNPEDFPLFPSKTTHLLRAQPNSGVLRKPYDALNLSLARQTNRVVPHGSSAPIRKDQLPLHQRKVAMGIRVPGNEPASLRPSAPSLGVAAGFSPGHLRHISPLDIRQETYDHHLQPLLSNIKGNKCRPPPICFKEL
jgi:hypothetical protein